MFVSYPGVTDTMVDLSCSDYGLEIEARVLFAETLYLPRGAWNFTKIGARHWRLYQNDNSGAELLSDTKAYELLPVQLYLIPADMALRSRNDTAFSQFYMHFDLMGLTGIALQDAFDEPLLVPSTHELREHAARLGRLVKAGKPQSIATKARLKGLLYEVLGVCLEGMPPEKSLRYRQYLSELRPVLPAINHIAEAFAQSLPNAELAALCHMSEDYFIQQFRLCTGSSPAQYVINRRVAVAEQRLLFTEDTIERIAEETGFPNRYYFSRVFQSRMGRSPAAFRKEHTRLNRDH